MNLEALIKLYDRATRLRRRLDSNEGDGASWSAQTEDGKIHAYSIQGVKSPEELEDDIEGIFVWLWSLKDHVKKYLTANGMSAEWVEADISADPYLPICGDLANRSKHGGLDKKRGRSGHFPRLGRLNYQVPQEAIGSITIVANAVRLDVSKAGLVNLEMPVLAEDGRALGDAFKYLDYSLVAWEKMIAKAERRCRPDRKKLTIAYHETGHAVMALICGQGIKKVSLREMNSPKGTDKYLGSTHLDPFEQKESYTINEAIRRVRISLGGYASEILFSGGSAKIGGDDLTSAVKRVEDMMQFEEFRNFAATLPIPDPGALDLIENPAIRAFIDGQIHLCISELEPLRRQIQLIAETLYQKEELTGAEVSALFNS